MNNREAYQREAASFEAIVGYEAGARYLKRGGAVEQVMTVRADGGFFEMLGVPPLRGRTFAANDTSAVAVISERFWREHLNGDPSALGTTLTLDDQPVTIVGIMPASFQFPYGAASLLSGVASEARTDFWQRLERDVRPVSRIGSVTGRLKPGVSLAAAETELKTIARRLDEGLPEAARGRR